MSPSPVPLRSHDHCRHRVGPAPADHASRRVIGINSQIATGGNGYANVGIGFAIPIQTARQELGKLESGGTVRHAFLGIQALPVRAVRWCEASSREPPAAKAGRQ